MIFSLRFVILPILVAALYVPVIFFAIQRREDGKSVSAWLVAAYALIAMALNLIEVFWKKDQGNSQGLLELQNYGTLTLIFLMMLTVNSFLNRGGWWGWATVWAFWVSSIAILLTNALHLPETLWMGGNVFVERPRLGLAWTTLGWLIFAISLILLISIAGREARQQLFRNRLNYWWPALLLIFANDFLLFSNHSIPGNPFRLFGTIFMAYVVVTHDVPDLRLFLRRILAYILMAIIVVGLYSAGFLLIQAFFQGTQTFNPLLAGAVISLVLALFFTPLFNLINRVVGTWLKADQYDPNQTIHQYSETISNILDMEKLASIAVGIILESMQLERGFLFLVDSDREADGRKVYRISLAQSPEEKPMIAAQLDENGPIASYFLQEQRPLLQYDLDLLPVFKNSPNPEREWFDKLETEVYIPIFAKRKWIGLLAFGAKMSGNRYTREDLVTLSGHANQTAVALENARLVGNLMRLNNELRSARRQLEKNNQDLERIDQAKSDFISIASHELRTPLTVIKGYTEMLLEDARLDENIKLAITGIHEGTNRLHEVMDSMFDIAQIDARSLKPHLQPVDIGRLIKEVSLEQAGAIKERKQVLSIELPVLPFVKVDPNLLAKLFHHLIRNAIKYTPNEGKITVSGHPIPAIMDLPNGGVEIIFSDTGIGVDPNLRELIFSKFYQNSDLGKHSTSKTRFKGSGSGLGLALSKGIVEAHGGRIYVESPGYDEINFPGSQFHVILPLSKLQAGEEQKNSEPIKFQI
jgi:signal transduction histidine kinase